MTEPIQRGRTLVFVAITLFLGLMLLAPVLTGLAFGTTDWGYRFLYLLLTAALCYQLYQGRRWGYRFVIILSLLAGGMSAIGGIAVAEENMGGTVLLLTLAGAYLLVAGLLLFSPDVLAYFEHRNR